MPSAQQRLLALLAGTVLTATLMAVMYWARSVLIPIALAILLSFILAPIVTRLHRRGLSRILSVAITVGTVALATFGVGALISRQVAQLVETLPDRREAIKEKVIEAKVWLAGEGQSRFGQLLDELTSVISPQQDVLLVKQASPSFGQQLESYLSPAAEFLGQAAFTGILTVFMLLRREDLRNRAIRLIGDGRLMTTTRAVDDATQRISRYLLSQLLLNVTFGLIIAVGMIALGVRYSILWGVIAMIMRYVPYLGSWIGVLFPLAFSLTTAPAWGGGWGQPLCVVGLYLGLELVCGNFVEPHLFGQSVGISEVALLVAAAFWTFLWGPIGLILSGPLTACLLVLGRHVPRFRFLVVLIGDEPPLSPKVAFYQRLVAHDEDEASEVAHAASKELGTVACLDNVIVPALCLARRDAATGQLDANDLRFIVTVAQEVIEELAEAHEWVAGEPGERVRILLSPAREKAEHVAAEAFAAMLDPARWEVEIAGDDLVAAELVARVAEYRPAAVVIVMLPPGGVSHANYLIARLHRRFPDLKLFVARWGCEDTAECDREDSIRNVDGITRTLADTRKRLTDIHSILSDRPRHDVEPDDERKTLAVSRA